MRRRILVGLLFAGFAVAAPSLAQQIQVSKENRTVDVNVTEMVRVDAEVAVIELGVQNYAATHEDALTAANQILKALLQAGVPENQIQTSAVRLGESRSFGGEQAKQPKERQFLAEQSWTIRVAASDAQRVVDTAAQAGANQILSIEWTVKDTRALQAKASDAAMARALDLAARLAKARGATLGQVLYVSNGVRETFSAEYDLRKAGEGGGAALLPPPPPNLKLLPEKVQDSTTIRAIFAIE